MTTSSNPAVDQLIHEATDAEIAMTWTLDNLSDAGVLDDHEGETDALIDARGGLTTALRAFTHYSNGRPIATTVEIEEGSYFTMHWNPTITQHGERLLTTGDRRPWDEHDQPGTYQVYANEDTSSLRIVLLSPPQRPGLHVVR